MSCSTCHNVHREERDLAELSRKCIECHPPARCKVGEKVGRISDNCIDCHMPKQRSNVITINTPREQFAQLYRTHAIGIYRDVAQKLLPSLRQKQH